MAEKLTRRTTGEVGEYRMRMLLRVFDWVAYRGCERFGCDFQLRCRERGGGVLKERFRWLLWTSRLSRGGFYLSFWDNGNVCYGPGV
jgi:hypothetical protein